MARNVLMVKCLGSHSSSKMAGGVITAWGQSHHVNSIHGSDWRGCQGNRAAITPLFWCKERLVVNQVNGCSNGSLWVPPAPLQPDLLPFSTFHWIRCQRTEDSKKNWRFSINPKGNLSEGFLCFVPLFHSAPVASIYQLLNFLSLLFGHVQRHSHLRGLSSNQNSC